MSCEICGFMPTSSHSSNGHAGVCVKRRGELTPSIMRQIKEGITEVCSRCGKYKPVGCFCWWCKS